MVLEPITLFRTRSPNATFGHICIKYDKETLVNELSVHINHMEMHCEITEISEKMKK